MHEEHTPNEPLVPGTPVAPHAAAEHIGISPVGRWYAAALMFLEEDEALEANMRPANISGELLYVLGARGPELLEDM